MNEAMKIAISCDYLLERSHYAEIIENICEIFPEAPIYCFAHKKGAILGHIEQRPIKSTYLSTVVSTPEEFYSHSNKLPSLAKNLFISCDYDLIINISKGFSQGFNKCEKTKLITYLYDFDLDRKIKKSFLQKLFSPFINSWIKKTLNQSDVILTSRQELADTLTNLSLRTDIQVMPPPFRISDYALFPKDMFKHHFFAIEATGLDVPKAKLIIEWMKEWNYPFQFIGPDDHLALIKSDYKENTFFGNRCSGEHAPVLAASKAFISFNTEDFPALSLGAMATGRPAILKSELKKWVSGNGVFFVNAFDKLALKNAIEQLPNDESIEPQKIRAHVMDYHDVKFKAQLKRTLDKSFGEISKASDNSICC